MRHEMAHPARGMVTSVDGRRFVPRTDTVLADPRLAAAIERLGRARVKEAVARAQQQARAGQISPDAVADVAVAGLPPAATSLVPVLNATGVLLHTNLGRAPLSAAAVAAMAAAAGYTDLEFDLATGARGRRGRGTLAALAAAVPAAEAVHVVNNNAAALVLAATALAAGREIVVSRGEMIEIGDGFRLPELMASTGARLREVGTTNRTALADYQRRVRPGHRVRAQGAPVQLPGRGVHRPGQRGRAGHAGRPGAGRHRVRPAGPAPAAARRAGRRVVAAGGRRAGHRERGQAARRAAGRPDLRPGRRWSASWPGTRWPGRCGWTRRRPRRWRPR